MRFDLVTIFPGIFSLATLDYGIVRRAREAGLIEAHAHDLRQFTHDRHRTVDDRPFGGGEGMVLKPEPLFEAVESILSQPRAAPQPETAIILLSASGKLFRQKTARRWATLKQIILLCGRLRRSGREEVADHLATDEISIGDYVLSGRGNPPAALIVDAVTRLIPGALGNEDSSVNESFSEEGTVAKYPLLADAPRELTATVASSRFPRITRDRQVFGAGKRSRRASWGQPRKRSGAGAARKAQGKLIRNRPDLLRGATPSAVK